MSKQKSKTGKSAKVMVIERRDYQNFLKQDMVLLEALTSIDLRSSARKTLESETNVRYITRNMLRRMRGMHLVFQGCSLIESLENERWPS